MSIRVNDFVVQGTMCSFVTRGKEVRYIEVGRTRLTPEQLEELWQRYMDFDPEEDDDEQ